MIEIRVLDSSLAGALKDIRKYQLDVHKKASQAMVEAAYEIDRKQKEKLRFHSMTSGSKSGGRKNYSSLINANKVIVNKAALKARVENSHKAAPFFEKGTRPHPIRVKNKKVLATLSEYTNKAYNLSTDKMGNEWQIFGKKVQHPGTSPKPFFYWPIAVVAKKYINNLQNILKGAK